MTFKKAVLHFRYSEKQAVAYNQIKSMVGGRPAPKNYANINGNTVLYTECGKDFETPSKWDDFEYLGVGVYSHSAGYW